MSGTATATARESTWPSYWPAEWFTGDVLAMARLAEIDAQDYGTRLLADALEEAGCNVGWALNHLREEHGAGIVRCYVVVEIVHRAGRLELWT